MALAILIYMTVLTMLDVGLAAGSVGKPRKPVTPGIAAAVGVIGIVHVLGYAYLSTQV